MWLSNTPIKLFLVMLLATFWAQTQAQDSQFSAANNLIFNHDHLANISVDSRLNYRFVKSGSIEPGFEDDIQLNFKTATSVDERGATIDYFTGDRKRWTPDFNGAQGNPLLTLFLQRDINEMKRLTAGQWRHFQKRIKLAFENDAKIEPVVFEFSGKEYKGRQITITPYMNDPLNRRFKKYAAKYYVFTFAEKLPGMLYQIMAVAPDTEKKSASASSEETPIVKETITLAEVSSVK